MSDVNFLEKEGNRDEIFERLSTALDAGYREGRYSARFYAQAAGRQPHSLEAGTRSQDGGSQQTHGDRSGVPEIRSEHHSLKDDRQTLRQLPDVSDSAGRSIPRQRPKPGPEFER